ncbi:hypothetical protein QWY90_15200 [Flavobacterium paronense]|nr:hypothetical protein [Flavobacterium paronense]MDN3678658.1 hypothetical protein [Flavobacterium paronense]
MTSIQYIQSQVTAAPKSIEATLKLLSEDCTIPLFRVTEKTKPEI